jgi:hypothetical protein
MKATRSKAGVVSGVEDAGNHGDRESARRESARR